MLKESLDSQEVEIKEISTLQGETDVAKISLKGVPSEKETSTPQDETDVAKIKESLDSQEVEIKETSTPQGETDVAKLSPKGVPSENEMTFKKNSIVYQNSRIMLISNNPLSRSFVTAPSSLDSIDTEDDTAPDPGINSSSSPLTVEYFRKLYRHQQLCDLIILAGGGSFKLHKYVLTSKSEKYLNILKGLKVICVTYEIVLSDVSWEAARSVVEYLYDYEIKLTEANVDGILSCAIQLGLKSLLNQCKQYLLVFTVANVLNHLELTIKYGLTDLNVGQMLDMCIDHFEELSHTEEFLNLPSEPLILLLNEKSLHTSKESLVLEAVTRWLNRDLKMRLKHAIPILRTINFHEVDPKLLQHLIEENNDLNEVKEIKNMLFQAYKYHALQAKKDHCTE